LERKNAAAVGYGVITAAGSPDSVALSATV